MPALAGSPCMQHLRTMVATATGMEVEMETAAQRPQAEMGAPAAAHPPAIMEMAVTHPPVAVGTVGAQPQVPALATVGVIQLAGQVAVVPRHLAAAVTHLRAGMPQLVGVAAVGPHPQAFRHLTAQLRRCSCQLGTLRWLAQGRPVH